MTDIDTITKLKKEKRAIILAHYYTTGEVQTIADFVGDSLALSQAAAHTEADIILFAGVHFMAETAKILNPQKKVLIPDLTAGCSLADSCPADKFAHFLKGYPDHKVISYINCSAEVKACSDLIVTSGNALKIVNSLPKDEKIVFAPDRNLGAYINNITGRKMVLWNGACHVHDQIEAALVVEMKQQHPDAVVIAHPECKAVILALADFIGSTAAMLHYVKETAATKFIVITESGILYEMKKQNPEKQFFIINKSDSCLCNDCEYMKKNNLHNICQALLDEKPELVLEDKILESAKLPIERMLALS